jgi:hypothetical protein
MQPSRPLHSISWRAGTRPCWAGWRQARQGITALSLYTWPRWWWAVGAGAILASQIVILTAWSDARYGTIVNGILLVGVVLGYLSQGPSSFRAEYEREVAARLTSGTTPLLTQADLAAVPEPVQRYMRLSGAVGQPRVRNFRARIHGQFRGGPTARWMSFVAEQYNLFDEPSRLFLMRASMFGLPVVALHEYIGPSATFRVKVASLVPVADARGPDLDESETVTLFNDMCVFAPGALVAPSIQWQPLDAHRVRGTFTNAGHTIHAVLSFNDRGELTDFVSEDRSQASPDGKSFTRMPWSTPVTDYQTLGPYRLFAFGEVRWHAPSGEFAYMRLYLDGIEYNVRPH